ncbi:unannotated protein [freshwater metagenome]|uniref:Unannotated protein n=1 Tax=freshwater metagenome TaxID=449393 RepID=A0A6J7JRI3_9ZZZZ
MVAEDPHPANPVAPALVLGLLPLLPELKLFEAVDIPLLLATLVPAAVSAATGQGQQTGGGHRGHGQRDGVVECVEGVERTFDRLAGGVTGAICGHHTVGVDLEADAPLDLAAIGVNTSGEQRVFARFETARDRQRGGVVTCRIDLLVQEFDLVGEGPRVDAGARLQMGGRDHELGDPQLESDRRLEVEDDRRDDGRLGEVDWAREGGGWAKTGFVAGRDASLYRVSEGGVE